MIYARFVLFNYRLIVANFLIYDLIATTNASTNATPTTTTTPTPTFALASHKSDAPIAPRRSVNRSLGDLWLPSATLMTMMERAKTSTPPPKSVRILSRPRRYLSFPEGSSFTVFAATVPPRLPAEHIHYLAPVCPVRCPCASLSASSAILTMRTIVLASIGAWPTICPITHGSCRACTASRGVQLGRQFCAGAAEAQSIGISSRLSISKAAGSLSLDYLFPKLKQKSSILSIKLVF